MTIITVNNPNLFEIGDAVTIGTTKYPQWMMAIWKWSPLFLRPRIWRLIERFGKANLEVFTITAVNSHENTRNN